MDIEQGSEQPADPDVPITPATVDILRALLQNPEGPQHYAWPLMKAAKVSTGTLYPVLVSLEEAHWIVGTWEELGPEEQRPPRRGYSLTREGTRLARLAIAEHDDRPRGGKRILAGLLRPILSPAPSVS